MNPQIIKNIAAKGGALIAAALAGIKGGTSLSDYKERKRRKLLEEAELKRHKTYRSKEE
ncbi:MAG: hypothetical protein ACM3PP_03955 [Candidatus Saccharibacteria bacterium]